MPFSIPWLDTDCIEFPNPETALSEPNGLLAAGGDLSSKRLITAYQRGIFPWFSEGEPILWWSPNPRAVIFPGQLHISRSLQKTLSKGQFTFSHNHAFEQVIAACRQPRLQAGNTGTWITKEMQQAYVELHQQGYAMSFECWLNQRLVGGIYGVVLNRCFFGESMFSHVRDASKAVMVELDRYLQANHFKLLDCQVSSEHLLSLGAVEIPRHQFIELIQ